MRMIQTLSDTPACKQTHWELTEGEYVVVSSIDNQYAKETMAFKADCMGDIVSFSELFSTLDVTMPHELVIEEILKL